MIIDNLSTIILRSLLCATQKTQIEFSVRIFDQIFINQRRQQKFILWRDTNGYCRNCWLLHGLERAYSWRLSNSAFRGDGTKWCPLDAAVDFFLPPGPPTCFYHVHALRLVCVVRGCERSVGLWFRYIIENSVVRAGAFCTPN